MSVISFELKNVVVSICPAKAGLFTVEPMF